MRQSENSKLASRIDQQLNAYAVAASAAGVALLACSLPADARVICRTTSNSLLGTLTIPFNPANEKFPPFNLAQTFPIPSGTSSSAFYWNRRDPGALPKRRFRQLDALRTPAKRHPS